MLASRHGLKGVVSVLSERTDPNTTTNDGFTALMETASNNILYVSQSNSSLQGNIATVSPKIDKEELM